MLKWWVYIIKIKCIMNNVDFIYEWNKFREVSIEWERYNLMKIFSGNNFILIWV